MSESTRKMISDRVRSEFNSGIRRRNEARREIGLEEVDEEFDGFKDEVVEDTDETDAPDPADALGDVMADASDVETDPTPDDGPVSVTKETYTDYPDAASENARMALEARE